LQKYIKLVTAAAEPFSTFMCKVWLLLQMDISCISGNNTGCMAQIPGKLNATKVAAINLVHFVDGLLPVERPPRSCSLLVD
jgi:hypothetical protein